MSVLAPPRTEHELLQLEPKTYIDLLATPDDGNRYELVAGDIVMSPAPATKHQYALGQLHLRLSNHVLRRQLGLVLFAPVDVKLSVHNVLQPDLIVVSRARVKIVTERFVDGPPDVIVEILSPSTRMQDLVTKAALYADHGVLEYWIVDPETDAIAIYSLREGRYVPLPKRGEYVRSEALPGLRVRAKDIFTMPDWMLEATETTSETE